MYMYNCQSFIYWLSLFHKEKIISMESWTNSNNKIIHIHVYEKYAISAWIINLEFVHNYVNCFVFYSIFKFFLDTYSRWTYQAVHKHPSGCLSHLSYPVAVAQIPARKNINNYLLKFFSNNDLQQSN